MEHVITAHAEAPTVAGWRYLWLKYVSGFRPYRHCAGCLLGPYSRVVHVGMLSNSPALLDEAERWNQLYLCGVALRGGWEANMHLAVEPAEGLTASVRGSTGVTFTITNARALEIPFVPSGHAGKSNRFTTCRNWRFGVHHYGLFPTRSASGQPAQRSALLAT